LLRIGLRIGGGDARYPQASLRSEAKP